MVARAKLIILNIGSILTLGCPGCEGTIFDVTFAMNYLMSARKRWRIQETFTARDHQYNFFKVINYSCQFSDLTGGTSEKSTKANLLKLSHF